MKLTDPRKTKTVELPSFEGSKLEIYDSILLGDLPSGNMKGFDNTENIAEMLPVLIKSWNFLGDDEQPLPINKETVKRLPAADVTFLLGQIKEFAEETKKN